MGEDSTVCFLVGRRNPLASHKILIFDVSVVEEQGEHEGGSLKKLRVHPRNKYSSRLEFSSDALKRHTAAVLSLERF